MYKKSKKLKCVPDIRLSEKFGSDFFRFLQLFLSLSPQMRVWIGTRVNMFISLQPKYIIYTLFLVIVHIMKSSLHPKVHTHGSL